jgi:ABC-type multidrug transport system fused ATPase/permease subunit
VEKISAAIGDNISMLIQWNSTFLAAFVVGMVREYRLALLLLAIIPFMALAGYTIGKVLFSSLSMA